MLPTCGGRHLPQHEDVLISSSSYSVNVKGDEAGYCDLALACSAHVELEMSTSALLQRQLDLGFKDDQLGARHGVQLAVNLQGMPGRVRGV